MPRVTASDVRAAMQTEKLSDAELGVFIGIAAMRLAEEIEPNASYSEQRYTEIERFLAAHYAATADPSTDRETINAVSIEYESISDNLQNSSLDETRYGRRAQELDTDDWLHAEEGGPEILSFSVQSDWEDYYRAGGPY